MLVFEEVNLKKLFPPRFNSCRAFFGDAQSPQRSTVYKQHLTTFI